MKRSLFAAAAGLVLALGAVGPNAYAANPQQARMTQCNADAKSKSLKGEERKSFMKGCLSSGSATSGAAPNTQQQKMKSCNANASSQGLKGDARKKYMSGCLKG